MNPDFKIDWRAAALAGVMGAALVASAQAAPARKSARKPAPAKKAPAKRPVVNPFADIVKLRIEPDTATLPGSRAAQQFVVTGVNKAGQELDLTGQVAYTVSAPKVAAATSTGRVTPKGDGEAKVTVKAGTAAASALVKVENAAAPMPVSFANDVMPVLSKAGCNTTACHGSPVGKAGFKLSLFGYEPELDAVAIAKDADGRRVDLKNPEKSLLLQKAVGAVPHGGGPRFKATSPEYRTLAAWVKEGAPGIGELEARIKDVAVVPGNRIVAKPNLTQRLVVTANFSDGSKLDVTDHAIYSSNDDSIAEVDDRGVVTAKAPGETAVMIRHLGRVAVARVAVLPTWTLPKDAPRPIATNFIDRIVFEKLERLRVQPSAPSSDEEFVRRVYVDVAGIVPSPEEAKAFLEDKDPAKRAKLIDTLLQRGDHVDLWTLKWSDTLRNNPQLTRTGLVPFHTWIREQLEKNVPFDQVVRDLLTATGRNGETPPDRPNQTARVIPALEAMPINGAVNYFMVAPNPLDLTSNTSQIFMGVRLECARCHNHPFEKWTINDYFGLAANFSGVRIQRAGNLNAGGVFPAAAQQAEGPRRARRQRRPNNSIVRHPKTNEEVEPRFLDGTEPEENVDPRVPFAKWLTAPENPFFARNIVNRVWAHYFGRGIVDPVDDFRVTNPPSNPALLDALAKEFTSHNFDVRHVERVILNSQVYQLSSVVNNYNKQDTSNFARAYPRRLSAEQLFDSISQATNVFPQVGGRRGRRQRLAGGVQGQVAQALADIEITRATQIPVPRAPGEIGQFLDTFGRPRREVTCECERSAEGNMSQALILLNSDLVNQKIAAPRGRVNQLLASAKSDTELIEGMFLAALSRRPTPAEVADSQSALKSAKTRAEGAQDVMWGLLNSREFLFNH